MARRTIRYWCGMVERVFHFAAAALALGLVAGFYVRGVGLEYRAGWESTFLGPTQVRQVVRLLYGPASLLTGLALPSSPAAIEALHWRGGAGGGPAAQWIHLMAATALIFVIVPRVLLGALPASRCGAHARSDRRCPEASCPTSAACSRRAMPHCLPPTSGDRLRLFPRRLIVARRRTIAARGLRARRPHRRRRHRAVWRRGGVAASVWTRPTAGPAAQSRGDARSGESRCWSLRLRATMRCGRRPATRLLVLIDESPLPAAHARAMPRWPPDRRAPAGVARLRGGARDLKPCFVRPASARGQAPRRARCRGRRWHAARTAVLDCAGMTARRRHRQPRAAVAYERGQDHARAHVAAAGHRRGDGSRARHGTCRSARADADA